MKVLVTGDQGFIGSNLKKALELNEDYKVYGLDKELFDSPNWKQELELYLDKVCFDAIFHVGACADTLNQDVEYMMTRNYESTVIISNWAKQDGTAVIYSSSAANYGDPKGKRNLYAWSKYAAEEHVIANGQIALRYFNVYGPGEEHKGKMASVAYQMFVKHKNGEAIKLFPGRPKRDFVYIQDVVNANLQALWNYDELAGVWWYDIGSGEANSFESVLEHLDIPYTYTDESEIPTNYQMFTQANKQYMLPGWKPKYTLEKGLKLYKEYLCKTF